MKWLDIGCDLKQHTIFTLSLLFSLPMSLPVLYRLYPSNEGGYNLWNMF